MNANIQVGDLVMIVRPDCERAARFVGGRIGKVEAIGTLPTAVSAHCDGCGRRYAVSECTTVGYIHPPLSWLRKIPPLSELEDTENKEVLHA